MVCMCVCTGRHACVRAHTHTDTQPSTYAHAVPVAVPLPLHLDYSYAPSEIQCRYITRPEPSQTPPRLGQACVPLFLQHLMQKTVTILNILFGKYTCLRLSLPHFQWEILQTDSPALRAIFLVGVFGMTLPRLLCSWTQSRLSNSTALTQPLEARSEAETIFPPL